ncbi:DUF6870 family protein [Caproicibacter fermentans]|uniref:DUF6870 domain-containing protein n=1 Tax=Caproicibacter fermentans TaxID=2576756 RepID=A0A7G8TF79_9FIRM|nr:hypothetical protein [Caproicibacter fermentans]QNK42270.1 hypothetical protein HCR03_08710 [Caproicibacter fermentans]
MGNSDFSHIDFDALKKVDVRTVDPDTLVDISKLDIDTTLPKEERMKEFVRQVRNPYCFKVGKISVGVSFSSDGVSFEQRMEHYLHTL